MSSVESMLLLSAAKYGMKCAGSLIRDYVGANDKSFLLMRDEVFCRCVAR